MKKRILSMILALVLVVGIMPTATFASIGEDEKHLCDAPGSYCLVCEVAEKINALPAKDDINVNNAAAVIEDIHAIDRIKFDLTDEQYEELLTLVENENYAPARYFDAVDAIKALDEGSSFYITKGFLSENGNVDVSNASVKFKVTNTETGASQTLTMSAMPYQLGSLSADADFYSANSDGSGWSYKYILPAGNYKIEEIGDSGATVDGEPFVTGSTFCSVDGSEETEGKTAAFTVEDGGNTVVTFDNVLPGGGTTYTVTFMYEEGVYASVNSNTDGTLGIGGMGVPGDQTNWVGWCTEDNIWIYHGMTVTKNLTAYAVYYADLRIEGTTKVGGTLTAEITITPTNENVPITLNYQWKRGNSAISGATNKTYEPTQEDVGSALTCEITVVGSPRPAFTVTSETIEADVFPVTVENGTADKAEAKEGETVTIIANFPAIGKIFSGWTSDDVTFENASAELTTFVMPAKEVTVTANYLDCNHQNNTNEDDDDCTTEVKCSVCSGTAVAANSHNYSGATYEWSADGKSCVAKRSCQNDGCKASETATATITSNEKTPATCTEMGTTTYTATFTADWATEQTKNIQDIPATKHDWSVEYEWSADGKFCKAIRVCGNDEKHNISEEATITSAEKTPATCSEMGTTTYTATFNADWATEQTKDVQDIQIVPHDWNDTTYEWSTDGKSCVATRTCKNYEKCNGSETATATITSNEKTSATCTEMGTTTYTATFTADWATEQTKDVQDIPAIEHDWSVEYEWSADGKSCKAIRVCGNDAKHNISEEATITSAEKTPATCTEMGTTTYTATFTADWATEQTKDVQDIPAIEHDWNDTTYEWSADGKSCKAIRVCGNNEEHVETAIATVKGKVVKKATCIEKGDTLYTATFNVDWAAEQTKTITDIEIDADNHNVVIDKASDPTCTETGLTEGKHCSDCKKILVEQQTIKALGHDYGRWVKIYEPTETEPGVKVKTCHNCGKKIYADIAPLSKDGIEELGPGAGKPETGTETNPNTGAPALIPFAAAFAILSGTVVFKKKK